MFRKKNRLKHIFRSYEQNENVIKIRQSVPLTVQPLLWQRTRHQGALWYEIAPWFVYGARETVETIYGARETVETIYGTRETVKPHALITLRPCITCYHRDPTFLTLVTKSNRSGLLCGNKVML